MGQMTKLTAVERIAYESEARQLFDAGRLVHSWRFLRRESDRLRRAAYRAGLVARPAKRDKCPETLDLQL